MKKIVFTQLVVAVLFAFQLYGQDTGIDSSLAVTDTLFNDFGLFESDDVLNLTLRFDIGEYMRKKPKEEYLKALLTYHINEKDSINKEIRLRSRGISRNSICNFPPITLNFSNEDNEAIEHRKIEKIKVVTHCNSGNEEYLFREYLIYKLYNALTDLSFRVRLVKIDYISTAKSGKVIRTYAFLIEPINMLTERAKVHEVENLKLSQKNIVPEIMDRVSIFNYMIGNTDWSVPKQHNIKIVTNPEEGTNILGGVIPYDFDYSGLVNAHYALPAEPLGLKSVRERRYLGACRSDGQLRERLKQFSDKKSEFYRIINEFQYLTEKDRYRMTWYLEEFFELLDQDLLIREVKMECMEGL
jgi:hypothetical protein